MSEAKRRAFVAVVVEEGSRLGIATEGEPGYSPYRPVTGDSFFNRYDDAKAAADALNESLFKLSREEALKIVWSSMQNGVE